MTKPFEDTRGSQSLVEAAFRKLYGVGITDYIAQGLAENQTARDMWNSMTERDKWAFLENNYTHYNSDFDTLGGILGSAKDIYLDTAIQDLLNASVWGNIPDEPDYDAIADSVYNGEDRVTREYLAELENAEQRQTSNFENQLRENNAMFDSYRSNILGQQYNQNAQLMDSVEGAMSKARRNALEAGASAGLRLAENINTTLSLQNKQSQISLETSNQLAQQLLNQRQAAAGIRGDYNAMLDANASERRAFKKDRVGELYSQKQSDYQTALDNRNEGLANDLNPAASYFNSYAQRKKYSQSQFNSNKE